MWQPFKLIKSFDYNFVIYLYNSRASDESGGMVGHNLGCGEDDEDDNLTGQYNYNQKLTKGKIVISLIGHRKRDQRRT